MAFRSGSGGDFTMDSYELMTSYRLNPALPVGAAYIYNIGKADYQGCGPFHQINRGASYSLSKRTELYGVFIFQKAAGDIARRCAAPPARDRAPRAEIAGGREFGLQSADADDDGHHPSLRCPVPGSEAIATVPILALLR